MDPVCYLCVMFVFVVTCSLLIACWKRADLLALLCGVFSCVLSLSHNGVSDQMWYLIVSIPGFCLPLYFETVVTKIIVMKKSKSNSYLNMSQDLTKGTFWQ